MLFLLKISIITIIIEENNNSNLTICIITVPVNQCISQYLNGSIVIYNNFYNTKQRLNLDIVLYKNCFNV